jgi:twitching motility protein PilT
MIMTGLVRESIRERAKTPQISTVIAAGQAQYGMQTFDQSLLGLVRNELVTVDEALRASSQPHDFMLMLEQAGLKVPA